MVLLVDIMNVLQLIVGSLQLPGRSLHIVAWVALYGGKIGNYNIIWPFGLATYAQWVMVVHVLMRGEVYPGA